MLCVTGRAARKTNSTRFSPPFFIQGKLSITNHEQSSFWFRSVSTGLRFLRIDRVCWRSLFGMFVPWPNRLVVSSSFFRKRALDHSIATYRREIKVWKRRGSSMVDGPFEFRPRIAVDCLSSHWPSFLFQPLLIAFFLLGCRPNNGNSVGHSSRLLLHHWLHRTFWYPPIELFFVGRLRLDDWQHVVVVGEAEASYNILPV